MALYLRQLHRTYLTPIMLLLMMNSACVAQQSELKMPEGQWYIELDHKDIGLTRTTIKLKTNGNTFTAYTRKDADKDILGGWTSLLGRTFTKALKGGSLLRIEEGIFSGSKDTLHLAGILVTPMGNYNLEGYIVNEKLQATIRNKSRGQLGTIRGSRDLPRRPMEDYARLFQQIKALTQEKIYDPGVLTSKQWTHFVKQMQQVTPRLQDDLEMSFAFFYHAGKLPFSHYAFMKLPPEGDANESSYSADRYVFLEEKSAETAYLKITSFGGTAQEMDQVFDTIIRKGYKHLIVDLRSNPGGSVAAGMAFATSIVSDTLYGGVFLTQKWFRQHQQAPAVAAYRNFPHFTEANFDLIIEGIHRTEGLCLKIIPKPSVYTGTLYLLTNKYTASTCEPIVYALKKQKRAIIVGEQTAGAMLNGEIFDLDGGFKLILPTAAYYASDGYRIDGHGVVPDIATQEDALQTVLDILKRAGPVD